jgi:hypothetical protein
MEGPVTPGETPEPPAVPPAPEVDPALDAPPAPAAIPLPAPAPPPPPVAIPLPEPTRIARRGYPALGVGLFLLYLITLARGVTFTDGPELVTAVHTLGVAHPTGYPIFILVGHAFEKLLALPLLVCVKVEIFNALCGAGAAVFTAHTARLLALLGQQKARSGEPEEAEIGGLVAGFMLGVAPLLWEEVRIPEVYAFHLFLVTWAGFAWARFEVTGKTGYVLGAALPMGIGLAHHVTMVYMLPAAFVYLMVRRPSFFITWITYPVVRLVRLFKRGFASTRRFEGWWGFPVACLIGFLPLLSYGFLIWADKHTTGVPWGDPHDWETLYNHFTGKQYQGFMHSLDLQGHLARVKMVAPMFDGQYLPEGTVMLFAGLYFFFQRAWKPALFFLVYMLFNVAHGCHYGVGDYATYYIPAAYACAVFMAVGLAGVLELARTRPAADRAFLGFFAAAVMLLGAAISVVLYARLTTRLPAFITKHPYPLAVPLGILGMGAVAGAIRASRVAGWPGPLPETALPRLILAGIVLSLAPITAARAHEYATENLVGESYGAEVATRLPPGSVLMTQGDGYLFTMWYETHVHGRAMSSATVDMGNIRTAWYQRYVFSHHPLPCDPRSPVNTQDPAGFAKRCDTFEKRMAMKQDDPWVSFGFAGNRRLYTTPASKTPVLRGADPQCSDKKWHDEHNGKECRCWGYGTTASPGTEGMLEEDCVESAEERGVVPREHVEIFAQRILEDMLAERPVFERNVLTQSGGLPDNPRGWDGPTYQRLSADYAMISRGRFNEIRKASEVQGHDACDGDTFVPLPAPVYVKPRSLPPGQERRRPYLPNPRPTLFRATFLGSFREARDDDASRAFHPGDPVFMVMDWFERFSWDATKPDKRGKPVHHGLRVCAFDPDGKKVASREVISGTEDRLLLLDEAAAQKVGTWHVAACTVGEIGEQRLPLRPDQRCNWTVLEYDFEVR